MPVSPTYPGVYLEEVPSGSRTVTGASTSVTAFVGRALRSLNHVVGPWKGLAGLAARERTLYCVFCSLKP
jgi:phage tail sheath protein FI